MNEMVNLIGIELERGKGHDSYQEVKVVICANYQGEYMWLLPTVGYMSYIKCLSVFKKAFL